MQTTSDNPRAVQGRVDLTDWNMTDRSVTLNGEWEFYPNTFLRGDASTSKFEDKTKGFIKVPGNWHSDDSPYQNLTYGSYRLCIAVQPNSIPVWGIKLPSIPLSSELYINGHLLAQSGKPAENKEQYTARSIPYSAIFSSQSHEIEIVIQVADYDNFKKGGITRSIQFGSAAAVGDKGSFSTTMQLILITVLLIHALYSGILYVMGNRQQLLLYFSLLMISALVMTLLDDDKLLLSWVPMSYEWNVKLIELSYIGISIFLIQTLKYMLFEMEDYKILRWFTRLCVLVTLFTLLTPIHYTQSASIVYITIILFSFFATSVLCLRVVIRGDEDTLFLLLSAIAITTNIVWGIIKNIIGSYELDFYSIDFILTVIIFACYCFRRYFRVVSETEMLAKKLQLADKRKDDFLANTSHELRNPLHGMLNIAQTVLESDRQSLSKKDTDHMQLLISLGRRMSFMLNDLLDLSILKEKGIAVELTYVRVQAVAAGVLDMLRFMIEDKPVRFIMYIPDSFPPVLADEKRLAQVLFNLLHNAVKFTSEGSVTIEAESKDGKAHIRITDTGIGMDEEVQKRIFQPYEQADSGMTGVGGGIGLGLSICRELVDLHKGTLSVQSTPGQGSVFILTLDLDDQYIQEPELTSILLDNTMGTDVQVILTEPEVSDLAEQSSNMIDATQILLVDDDTVNLNILKEILTSEAYSVWTATSGKEALSLFDMRDWDLIITDIMMPEMSGYELSRMIRDRFSISELPILFLTARSRTEDIEAGFLAGANDYVMKPVDAMELKARVRALTLLKKSIRERLSMEAACLQAQIQPHFLFNTLNSIAALSEFDTTRMRALLEEFGNYLRASFDFQNINRLVPLAHELSLVQSYLFIEKERFEERLQVIWEVDDSLPLFLPPLSIQPLVENAVKHGILARIEGGVLHIRLSDHEDYAEISIMDNGVGMDEAVYNRMLEHGVEVDAGIGLRNTHRRLKQIYGKGLRIESKPGSGTRVTFEISKKISSRLKG